MDVFVVFVFAIFMEFSQRTDVCAAITNYRPLKITSLQGAWGEWRAFLTISAKSRLHCAVLCTDNEDCDLAQWEPDTSECHLHSERNLIAFYPLTNGVSTSTVMIGKPLQSKSMPFSQRITKRDVI